MGVPKINRECLALTGAGLDKLEEKYPRLFMALVHHRNTDGDRMTFSDKKWLGDIYKDNARDMIFMKCSQVHMTEHALCAMYTLARQGNRGMYILPSKEHRRTFVADRIDRMKDWSQLYNDCLKEGTRDGSDSNVYKTIFGTGWKFVGSNIRNDFFEFPCSVLFFDEYDLLDQDKIKYAYDRIANARRPIIWKFGNPTRENFGIHEEWLESDQREWHVECHCGHEQIMDWYQHFVKEVPGGFALRHVSGMPICEECNEPFHRLGPGEWKALNPGAKTHGYHITRLFINKAGSKRGAQDILKLFKKFIKAQNDPTALQNFHNNYLAQTYENIDFKIDDALLESCRVKDAIEDYDPTIYRSIMGVDQGKYFTCTISIVVDGVLYDVHYTNVRHWSDVVKLEKDWNVVFTVVDAQGGGYEETRTFCKQKEGRYMCYYRPKDQIKHLYEKADKTSTVLVNRTEILDKVVQSMKNGKTKIPKDFKFRLNGSWSKQMKCPARVTDPNGRPIWTKGVDHFFHSSAYRYIAYLISGMKNSIASSKSWFVDKPIEKERKEPEATIIGGSASKTETKKRKSWHR